MKQQTIRETAVPHSTYCLNVFIRFCSVFLYLRKSRSSYTPDSGIPWAFSLLALRTSFAETKKMRFFASTGSITLSSSTRKVRQRSMCCLRTWGKDKKLMKKGKHWSISTSQHQSQKQLLNHPSDSTCLPTLQRQQLLLLLSTDLDTAILPSTTVFT